MSLLYLLDTNICIYIAKERPISAYEKFEELSVGEVGMSMITYGELYYDTQKSRHPKKALLSLESLKNFIPPLPFPIQAGAVYGEIRHKLEKKGKPIRNNDLWIASHAIALNLILVTNNLKEFSRVPGLKVENWVD